MERPPTTATYYSITGAVAQARLVPLLEEMKGVAWHPAAAATTTTTDTEPQQPLHFVWETHLPRHLKQKHDRALVKNRLANSTILEEKGHLARLMAQVPLPRLETYILRANEVQEWLDKRRRQKGEEEWWILKATGGNGGMDIHLLPPSRPSVPPSLHLHPEQPYVIQKYLTNPVLYEGKYKFHFRVYALLRIANQARKRKGGTDSSSAECSYTFEPRLYHHAYILRSSLPYDESNQEDDLVHLTNLSLHKKAPSYPGQIPVDLPRDFPEVYAQMKRTWAALIKAAAPFMRVQTSANHFEFFGLDFLLAETGSSPPEGEQQQVYLLEVNRLPGLQSSRQNFVQEEIFYKEMMRGFLRLCVCPPLLEEAEEGEEEGRGWERVVADAQEDQEEEDLDVELDPEGKGLYKNILKFGLYVKRNTL